MALESKYGEGEYFFHTWFAMKKVREGHLATVYRESTSLRRLVNEDSKASVFSSCSDGMHAIGFERIAQHGGCTPVACGG
jgi:hypothetical protein